MRLRCFVAGQLFALGIIGRVFADADSIAAINAVGLRRPDGAILSGAAVNVGEVDVARAGVTGFDSAGKSHPAIIPVESKNTGGTTVTGPDVGLNTAGFEHGLETAGIIIARANLHPGTPPGIAPNASLFSAGFHHPVIDPSDDANDQLLSVQYIAKRYDFSNPDHIRAINHSWADGKIGPFSGNHRLTLGMDWMASKFDVLNVIAGPYEPAAGGVDDVPPADNYNGITVAFTSKQDGYHRVDVRNYNDEVYDADGGRVSVDLLAPGHGVNVPTVNGGLLTNAYGSSIAAPHVTGGVAILNEFSDYQTFIAQEPRWDFDNPRRHEVLKAVLLNSANKSVIDEVGFHWFQSEAYTDDTISLDQQMGAGLLDVGRAVAQFAPGEYNVFELIPPIGWDWGETGGVGSPLYEYPFADELPVGQITITLAWDRRVDKTSGADNTFAPSDGFAGHAVDNLDLFLLPAGATDPDTESIPLLRSWSEDDNVEHIYADIPEKDDYKIVIYQRSGEEVDYGLAWWTGNPADFDKNGVVNGADLGEWKSDYGTSSESDADFDSDTDGNDLLVWQRNLGAGIPAVPVSIPVPESQSSMLCAIGIAFLSVRRGGVV